jgi:hypothetical protein
MTSQVFINVNNKSNVFRFDKSIQPSQQIKNNLFQFIEDRTNIHKMFFRFTFAGKSHRWLDDTEMILSNNSTVEFFVNHNLNKVRINDKSFIFMDPTILKESNLILTMNELTEDGLISNDENIVHLGDSEIISKQVIEYWIMLSFYLKKHLGGDKSFYKLINIPKPLPNNHLDKIIGSESFQYLDSLNIEELKQLATFCDFMDISYLLEIVCAFIANKYVKNKSLDEIKNLNLV